MVLTQTTLGPKDPGPRKGAVCVWTELDPLRLSSINSEFFGSILVSTLKTLGVAPTALSHHG